MSDNLTLIVIGDDDVGKSALAVRFCLDQFAEGFEPTLDDSYRTQIVVDERPCTLEILDTAGREEYTTFRDQYIRDGNAFILAYSVTSWSSFSHIRAHYNHIKEVKNGMSIDKTIQQSHTQRLCHSPIILVGTKNDLQAQREVSLRQGRMLAKSLNCWFTETSAKSDVDIEKTFSDVVRCFRQQNLHCGQAVPASSQSSKVPGRLFRPKQWKNGLRCVVM